MRNEFSKDLLSSWFSDNHSCFWCGESGFDAFHHILGRTSNSILNACPIHNEKCHLYNGSLNNISTRSVLLCKTAIYLSYYGYEMSKEDKLFMKKHERIYNFNKDMKLESLHYLTKPANQLVSYVSST